MFSGNCDILKLVVFVSKSLLPLETPPSMNCLQCQSLWVCLAFSQLCVNVITCTCVSEVVLPF